MEQTPPHARTRTHQYGHTHRVRGRPGSKTAMLIKEYRIPMPMSVEEYRIAQLYMIQVRIYFFYYYFYNYYLLNKEILHFSF